MSKKSKIYQLKVVDPLQKLSKNQNIGYANKFVLFIFQNKLWESSSVRIYFYKNTKEENLKIARKTDKHCGIK